MQRFTELNAWRHAHSVMLRVYRVTQSFPRHELYGITSQIRKAAVSVDINIAEGSRKGSDREFARFLSISQGSLAEVEALVIASRDLGYLPPNVADQLVTEIEVAAKIIFGLRERCLRTAAPLEAPDKQAKQA